MIFTLLLLTQHAVSFKRPILLADEYESVTVRQAYDTQPKITIEKTKYENIQSSTVDGGANYFKNTNFTINDCKFISCSGKQGGAIYVTYSGSGNIFDSRIENAEFTKCTGTSGGALYISVAQINQAILINHCTFTQNTASKDGGAIYALARNDLVIQASTFTNNVANRYASLYCRVGNNGGSDPNNTLVLIDNIFSFNAEENLTNVYICNNEISSGSVLPPTLYIDGCTFNTDGTAANCLNLEIDALAEGFSGIVSNKCNCVKQGADTVKIPSIYGFENINFDCTASDQCTPTEPFPEFSDDLSSDNQIPDTNTLTSISIENTTFSYLKETTKNGGGAICVGSNKVNMTLNKCNFIRCSTTFSGGAIYVMYSKSSKQNFTILIGKIIKCTFYFCEAKTNGGAIYIQITQAKNYSFSLEGCKFQSNKAKLGGGLYAYGRDLFTLSKCTFNSNIATTGSSLYLEVGGTAKSDVDNNIVVEDNNFIFAPNSQNKTNVYIISKKDNFTNTILNFGGNSFTASPLYEDFKQLQIIEKQPYQAIVFTKCNCIKQGGVESTEFPESISEITNFDFNCTGNTCNPGTDTPVPPPSGGEPDEDGYIPHDRINDEGNEINLKKYKFTETTADGADGGAILDFKKRVSCILEQCKFDSCKAKNGGAIYILFASNEKSLVCTIKETEFNNCDATTNGGAIYIQNTESAIEISSCTFTSNHAKKNGGALYLMASDNLVLTNCVFNNNNVDENGLGSSVWCRVGAATKNTTRTVTFSDNTFSFSPIENSVNVYIDNAVNTSNTSLPNAIFSLGLCRFASNDAAVTNFRHLFIEAKGFGFNSIVFPDCICVSQGENTVILPEGYTTNGITFNCLSYDSCKPDQDGFSYHERIGDEPRTQPINLASYKFKGIESEENGGAISIFRERTSLTLNNCKFQSCKGKMGGAIYILYAGDSANYTCTITNSVFTENEAASNGGAFYCEISQSNRHFVTLSHCTFTSNTAGKNGGAVYAMARDKFTLEYCTFENNNSPSNGIGHSLWLRVGFNDRYNYNKAVVRGNTFIFTPGNKNSVNVHIETFPLQGTTTPNANLDFGSNTFTSRNVAVAGYRHLEIAENRSPFESINFDGCNCVQNGQETVTLPYPYGKNAFNFNCPNSGSCATTAPTPRPSPDGNGYTPSERIKITEGATLRLSKTKFTSIESTEAGGALSLTRTRCELADCKFESCKSTAKLNGENNGGGAIYIFYSSKSYNYTASIVSCQFTNCEAVAQGGAINVKINQPDYHSVDIEGCTFTNNKANYGGAVYSIVRDALSIQHCTFTNNVAASGSSLWCQIGWNEGKDVDNNLVLYNNKFTFTPSDSNPTNVYIQSNSLKENIAPNANILIGLCQFDGENIDGTKHKSLLISEVGAFQSIVFTDCNCFKGDQKTVVINVATAPNRDNLKFNCVNNNQCPADSEQKPGNDECKSYPKRQESFGSSLKLEKTCFENLKSTSREGGALRVVNSNLELEKCRFTACSSTENGGALYVSYSIDNCELEVENCTFENCESNAQGGAFYFSNSYQSESSIIKCIFRNNKAASHGGALYFSPCAFSLLASNLFVDNSCPNDQKAHGSAVYIIVQNLNVKQVSNSLKLTDDEDDSKVIIQGNKIRSQPVENSQQMFVDVKKSGSVKIDSNSFSFNGAEVPSASSKYVQVSVDEGADIEVAGQLCVDYKDSTKNLVSGIEFNIDYDCHKADPEFDNEFDDVSKKKKNNTGMIVGIVIGVVVVIAVVCVVVYFVLRKKNEGKYISDLGEDGLIDTNGGNI